MNHVFVALIEVRPLDGCELDPSEYEGAAVRCYIPATNENIARALLSKTLKRDRFELVEEEFFVREDKVEWENPESPAAKRATAEAITSGFVVYSEFHAWGFDAPDSNKNEFDEQDSSSKT